MQVDIASRLASVVLLECVSMSEQNYFLRVLECNLGLAIAIECRNDTETTDKRTRCVVFFLCAVYQAVFSSASATRQRALCHVRRDCVHALLDGIMPDARAGGQPPLGAHVGYASRSSCSSSSQLCLVSLSLMVSVPLLVRTHWRSRRAAGRCVGIVNFNHHFGGGGGDELGGGSERGVGRQLAR